MTRIDFYQLNPQQHNQDRVVCQLCQKAYENNQLTLLLTQSEQQTAHLDRHLWIFEDESFIPHDVQESDDFKSPILIHNAPELDTERHLLINLADTIPAYFAQFERIIELVTENNKQQAREHYSYYKERGYPLNHHNL
jgi:DNA polymerase-3 subunit chi